MFKNAIKLTPVLSPDVNTRPKRLLMSPVPGITEIAEPTMLVMFEEENVPPWLVLTEAFRVPENDV